MSRSQAFPSANVVVFSSFILIAIVAVSGSTTVAATPALTARDTGVYAITSWGSASVPPPAGSTEERTAPLTFTVRSIWNNAGNSNPDLGYIRDEINSGLGYSPAKTMLVRVQFWDGEDRYQGPMLDRNVYLQRVLQSVQQLEPVLDKIHGITLSEENVPFGGRTQVLQYIYDKVKEQYPALPIYQWWTPNTGHPKQFEGTWLSADGWVFDPYTLTAANPPYADLWSPDPYLRLVQKFVVTGTPLIAMAPATAETAFRPYYDTTTTPFTGGETLWDLIDHQTRINTAYNIPTSFYWTGQNGEAYFPTVTPDPLLNQLNQFVRNFADNQKQFPASFAGDETIADTWSNGPDTIVAVHPQRPNNIIYEDKFLESDFLEESSGHGLRDLIINGQNLRTRGFNGRDANAEMIYHFQSAENFIFPLVALNADVNGVMGGIVGISVSTDGTNWTSRAQTTGSGNQLLELPTLGSAQFASLKNLWVKIELDGAAGTFESPAARIDNLRIVQNAASVGGTLLNVNFDTEYATGSLDGQSGGIIDGAWNASETSGSFQVVTTSTSSRNAARLSRSAAGGEATVGLEKALNTDSEFIRFGFDFLRPNNSARGVITLRNSASGNNTGFGIEIRNDSGQPIRFIDDSLFTAGEDATYASTFIPVNNIWYRVEFDIDGENKLYDLYISPRGAAVRTLIASDIPWNAPNQLVDEFYFLPQGLSESILYLDNLFLYSSQPIPEPMGWSTGIILLLISAVPCRRC